MDNDDTKKKRLPEETWTYGRLDRNSLKIEEAKLSV